MPVKYKSPATPGGTGRMAASRIRNPVFHTGQPIGTLLPVTAASSGPQARLEELYPFGQSASELELARREGISGIEEKAARKDILREADENQKN